ncbi:MAG TPA: tetratricopeptide repeat protein, partial [Planctomycetaceae bacterium]|nr:tetratricopeptide repeat protein [Planctomycetaceae bacterium]
MADERAPSKGDAKQAPADVEARKGGRGRLLLGLGLVAGLMTGAAWYLLRDSGPPPKERLQQALELLKHAENSRALKKAEQIALDLKKLDYRDPDFAGAVEFILGMTSFRQAEQSEAATRERRYVQAAKYLREAEWQALHESWRPEWAYALGVSLLRIGSSTEARPLLEEAVESYPPGRAEASMLLSDIYLDMNSRSHVQKALELNDWVIQRTDLTPAKRDRALLQRAQILQLLGREAEAQAALDQVSEETNKKYGSMLIKAQTLMAEGHYEEALSTLEPLAAVSMLNDYYVRQALFRMGLCSERLAERASDPETRKLRIDAAIDYYERTAQRFPNSHESLAANLRVADLLRKCQPIPRTEEALEMYRRALRSVRRVEDFRNRWVSLEEFRQTILRAWNEWVDGHDYEEAITLANYMVPLFPKARALELAARAHQHWAEYLAEQVEQAPDAKRPPLEKELRARWRASGRSFAKLADEVRITSRYPDLLWTSAEHYYLGHDFESALTQLDQFIALQRRNRLPAALVRKGECLMHLGRYEDALNIFRGVMAQYPTDPAFFRAQYVIGQCLLEQNKVDEAEKAWRDVLASETLTPAAEEWRLALFCLARLLYRRAAFLNEPSSTRSDEKTAGLASGKTAELILWDEAISRFDEYLQRYPQSAEAIEGAYLLAESLVRSAQILRQHLAKAETENARFELRDRIDQRLGAALAHLRNLQSFLSDLQRDDRLGRFGQRALHDSYFEIARVLFQMEKFDEAIEAYRAATY